MMYAVVSDLLSDLQLQEALCPRTEVSEEAASVAPEPQETSITIGDELDDDENRYGGWAVWHRKISFA